MSNTFLATPACAHSFIGLGHPFPRTLIPSSSDLNASTSEVRCKVEMFMIQSAIKAISEIHMQRKTGSIGSNESDPNYMYAT